MAGKVAVTFGDDGLDRAAHLRGDDQAMARLAAASDTRSVVLWRGRVLLSGEATPELVRLPMDHALLRHATRPPVFLGTAGAGARFAHDLSDWDGPRAPDEAGLFDTRAATHEELGPGRYFADLRSVMAALPPLEAGLAASARAILGWHEAHGFCARCGQASAVAMAGWQRQCPACGARHFPRIDPVVIMLVIRDNRVLLGRSPGWPEGMVSLLAGFVEPGETLETAVRREVWEETRVRIGAVGYLASQPWPFPSSLMIGCRAEALSDEITADPVEIEDAFWLTREELLDVFSGSRGDIRPARPGSVARHLLRNWLAGGGQ